MLPVYYTTLFKLAFLLKKNGLSAILNFIKYANTTKNRFKH